MLKELKRPSVEVFVRDAESVKQSILAKYSSVQDLIDESSIDDDAFKDLLTCLNFSLDCQDNQIFYDTVARKVLIYDIVNEKFVFEEDDIINIIEA